MACGRNGERIPKKASTSPVLLFIGNASVGIDPPKSRNRLESAEFAVPSNLVSTASM